MKSHIVSNHSVGVFICDNCRETFSSEDDLKTHATEKHSYKTKKQILIVKKEELILKIKSQRIKIFEDLYILKEKEVKERKTVSERILPCFTSKIQMETF